MMLYWAPLLLAPIIDLRGHKNYQYNMIMMVKAWPAEQCMTAKKIVKTRPLEPYEGLSSQGMTPSPGAHCGRKHERVGAIVRRALQVG